MNYIYHLLDPITKIVRYVGNTKNPKSRYKQHIKDAEKRCKTQKQIWIRNLKLKNLAPYMEIVKSIENDEDARKEEEKEVIKHIETVFNIHLPGKGSKDISHYKKTGKTN